MNEVNFSTADFDDIAKFAQNLLGIQKINHPGDYDAQIAYFSTSTQIMLARRTTETAQKLGVELAQLTRTLDAAAAASEQSAKDALRPAKRMVIATWALVAVTFILGAATGGLVLYTRQLARNTPVIMVSQPAK